ncbi:LLM class flavin-dependent oxidoreductase [Hoyosella altamirensis]|uniref:Alkanesulfonate monooxygenase SsuD/methylene tetrahydromethanopterin reductase-like flavin-dependent oxidoreductase (Luciferase family) n=1 Tax=Hoyosella altamirensis TaxID=616997 RepID=A0A839RID6_9ACTN|nr:LLM class flavin-dependent oxidoreductase [Hoyosella altamirensis]MBB3036415.1 alkanesulfonate monooxygenase SsuD/methylene tetrahydromethanopterin reductase-like flavin-dependent oxidoreductase (luciferase family) [Hoyosella altamirensis]
MHPQFGFFLTPNASDASSLVSTARLLDELGYDFAGIQDHPYQRRFLDTWTLISYLAAHTRNIRFFPDVASLPLRPPAILAKSAASLDVLSGGRVEVGLGAGAFWDAIEGMGGPRRSPGEALQALREAIDVMRLMWSDQRSVSYDGEIYQLNGIHPGPVPAHAIEIWLGVTGPRALALLGSHADGWVPSMSFVPPEKLPGLQARIDDAAVAANRDPAAIRRVYNIWGEFERNEWIDLLSGLARDQRIGTFILGGPDDEATLRWFAEDIIPAVRAEVSG